MPELNEKMRTKKEVSTPTHGDKSLDDLNDTPTTNTKHQTARGLKRLKKKSSEGNQMQEEVTPASAEEKVQVELDLCDSDDIRVKKSGGARGKDTWTEEELEQEEYGHKRRKLRQYRVDKGLVENLNKVKDQYPGLEGVIMDSLHDKINVVAETIHGVPMWDGKSLMEKETKADWLRQCILCQAKAIPEECQYKYVEEEAAIMSEYFRERSRYLYEKKKKEEEKPLELLRCFVHGEKQQTILELSK